MNLQTFQDCSHKLIGLPYDKYDCWGLCKEFYKLIFDIDVLAWFDYDNIKYEVGSKQWAVLSNHYINDVKSFFKHSPKPKFGDIVLIKLWGIPSHVAIYLGDNKILHTNEKNGSFIDRFSRWEKMVEGYYEYVAC